MSTETKNAIVTTTAPDGTVQTQECKPDDYVIVLGPDRYISNVQSYPAKGTVVLTIKTEKPEPPDHVRGGETEQ